MKLTKPPKGVTARGVCVSLTLAFPKRGLTTGCIVLFLPVTGVLGSNPFCLSSQEQNDLFLSQVFGFNRVKGLPQTARQNRALLAFVTVFLLLIVFIGWNLFRPATDSHIETIR